jgi:hypothetical protein
VESAGCPGKQYHITKHIGSPVIADCRGNEQVIYVIVIDRISDDKHAAAIGRWRVLRRGGSEELRKSGSGALQRAVEDACEPGG